MKNIVKKIAVFSMIGMMQIGLGASAIEASPRYYEPAAIQQQDGGEDGDHGEEQRYERERHERERHEQERIEQERHEREMRRREHENEREWRERQQRENERHDENQRRIAHDILDLILDR